MTAYLPYPHSGEQSLNAHQTLAFAAPWFHPIGTRATNAYRDSLFSARDQSSEPQRTRSMSLNTPRIKANRRNLAII
jgi:hypothetical protein